MLAFKLVIHVYEGLYAYPNLNLKEEILKDYWNKNIMEQQINILKSNNRCVVDVKVGEITKNNDVMFGFVMKSVNGNSCHMEPIYKYQCQYCKCEPWLG